MVKMGQQAKAIVAGVGAAIAGTAGATIPMPPETVASIPWWGYPLITVVSFLVGWVPTYFVRNDPS